MVVLLVQATWLRLKVAISCLVRHVIALLLLGPCGVVAAAPVEWVSELVNETFSSDLVRVDVDAILISLKSNHA